MKAPRISIVIRARDEGAWLQRCLDALRAQTYSPDEIILVYDERSTDETLAIAQRNELMIVALPGERFSFGHALNLGCERAKGDYIVLVSAHAIPASDTWLAEAIAPLESDLEVAATFSRQIPHPGTCAHLVPLMERAYPATGRCRGVSFSNAASVVRSRVWKEIPFDETLEAAEDLAWARKVAASGYAIRYCPRSLIFHSHDESFAQVMSRTSRCEEAAILIGHCRRSLRRLGHRALVILTLIGLDGLALFPNLKQIGKLIRHRVAMLCALILVHTQTLRLATDENHEGRLARTRY